ncbi:NADPH:quinone oxidoreductase family protein [Egibacter rhizosphaerae]|uniref:NADPH:quinone oxidoreductase family protein n=1 Tax=Egibacter rhizosphaerae TaxID=1670831 RepID=A0A411YGL7_9ACTN|nr:NADPH:quinone oxidoreductase family protein [Egibacter rhizosphaerae]QBI20316.1 NADPH:quinone oxidoreductase family protein [Egibacter rhizosphaerae]
MRAIRITEFGGPEVLELAEVPDPEPGDGEELIEVDHAGVNYADTHQTEDSYLAPTTLPMTPGAEVVGRTPDGRRVVALTGTGGYAQRAVARACAVFDVPDEVGDGTAAALLLQGTTAWHALHTSARVRAGESVVVHAAAGGVGSLAVQLAKQAGCAPVVAAASTEEKRRLARDLGADATIDARAEDLKGAIEEAVGGKADVVLEMVGGPTFDASLAALAPFGRLVTYGMAGRQPASDVAPAKLLGRSRGIIGFWLAHAFADPPRLLGKPLADLFTAVERGELTAIVGSSYPLSEAGRAHEDLRARRTVGKVLLDPST